MRALWVGLLALSATGCLMAGNYHSAKILEKGTSQFGLTFSATEFKSVSHDSAGNETSSTYVAIPNILPELTYHIGVSENVEAGGRIGLGSLGGEFDVKWRFLRSDKLHLAIAPAIGYQAFVIIEGGILRLPAILTYQLADNFDFNMAVFASETHFSTVDSISDYALLNGTLTATGMSLGVDLHGEVFTIRPAVEFTRYVYNTSEDSFDPFNTVNILVHLAWTGGREKKQLDRIERKIDNLQPQYPPPGGYTPPPGQYPPPAPPQEPQGPTAPPAPPSETPPQ